MTAVEKAARRIVKDWFCEIAGDWHREVCEKGVAAIITEEFAETLKQLEDVRQKYSMAIQPRK